MTDFIKYLRATQTFIASVPAGPLQETAYEKQRHAILRLLGQSRLSIEFAAEANGMLAQIFGGRAELAELQAAVCNSYGAASASEMQTGRRGLQDYSNISEYLTESLWNAIAIEGVESLEALLQHCVALGLQTPSEPTMQFVTVLYCLIQYDVARTSRVSLASRLEMVKGVKAQFKRILIRSHSAVSSLVHVPKLQRLGFTEATCDVCCLHLSLAMMSAAYSSGAAMSTFSRCPNGGGCVFM